MHSLLYSDTGEDTPEASNTYKYRFNNVPVNFMNNDLWKTVVEKLVDLCTRTKQEQNEIDSLYTQFCESFYEGNG